MKFVKQVTYLRKLLLRDKLVCFFFNAPYYIYNVCVTSFHPAYTYKKWYMERNIKKPVTNRLIRHWLKYQVKFLEESI